MTATYAPRAVPLSGRTPQLTSAERRALWVVMPCYNEHGSLREVASEVLKLGYSLVVVDDGSTTPAAELLAGSGAHVLRHCVNLGQGAALQTGIDYAVIQGAGWLVTFDSDGQHRAEEIERLVLSLLGSGADVALGTRFAEGGQALNIPRTRALTLRVATRLTRTSTGLEITDTHNGFRAFTREAVQRLRITQNRMAHASQILDAIARLGFTYVEVPVTIRYTAYSVRKGQRMSNAFNILWDSLTGRIS